MVKGSGRGGNLAKANAGGTGGDSAGSKRSRTIPTDATAGERFLTARLAAGIVTRRGEAGESGRACQRRTRRGRKIDRDLMKSIRKHAVRARHAAIKEAYPIWAQASGSPPSKHDIKPLRGAPEGAQGDTHEFYVRICLQKILIIFI